MSASIPASTPEQPEQPTPGPADVVVEGQVVPSYAPGKHMHFIHTRRVSERPWGWRDGVVRHRDAEGRHLVDYVHEQGSILLWSALCPPLPSGTPVRVHEEYWALDVAGRWYNVRRDSPGLGPVPEPHDLDAWRDQMTSGVTDLAAGTGMGLQPRHEPPASDH